MSSKNIAPYLRLKFLSKRFEILADAATHGINRTTLSALEEGLMELENLMSDIQNDLEEKNLKNKN